MKKPLTKRQKQLLEIIYKYFNSIGYPPTFEEMREELGVSSNQSIIDLLNKLKNAGLIRREKSAARGITILPLGYQVLNRPPLVQFAGVASAGEPIEAIAVAGEWKAVSTEIAKLNADTCLIKISGDSMVNAGINDGDIVLVQKKKEFSSGEIVLAYVEGEATVKRFISEDKPPYVYLKPENPKYENIPFRENMQIEGKIISILKTGYWKSIK